MYTVEQTLSDEITHEQTCCIDFACLVDIVDSTIGSIFFRRSWLSSWKWINIFFAMPKPLKKNYINAQTCVFDKDKCNAFNVEDR